MEQLFQGSESSENNPYQYSRIGMVIDILDDDKLQSNRNTDNIKAYMSVKIRWIEWGGDDGTFSSATGIIYLSYPHISRGWGSGMYKPSKGDIVHCSFRQGGYAVIDGYLPLGYYNKVKGQDVNGYFFRTLLEGEYSDKSKYGSEIYHDAQGSIHIITRDQTKTHTVSIDNGFEVISDVVVEDNPQVEVVVGKTFNTKSIGNTKQIDYANEVKSGNGLSTRVSVHDYNSGVSIIIDTSGNIEVITPGKLQISASDIELGDSSLEPAVKGTTLKQWCDTHVHPSPSGPTGATTTPLPNGALSTVVKVK